MPDLIGHRVQKDSESARGTHKLKVTAGAFPVLMRLIYDYAFGCANLADFGELRSGDRHTFSMRRR